MADDSSADFVRIDYSSSCRHTGESNPCSGARALEEITFTGKTYCTMFLLSVFKIDYDVKKNLCKCSLPIHRFRAKKGCSVAEKVIVLAMILFVFSISMHCSF